MNRAQPADDLTSVRDETTSAPVRVLSLRHAWHRSLFVRNLVLIALLVLAGQTAVALAFREFAQKPRISYFADVHRRTVLGMRAGLAALNPVDRQRLIERFNSHGSARIERGPPPLPATDDGPVSDAVWLFLQAINQNSDTDGVIARRTADGGLWAGAKIDDEYYWLNLPMQRLILTRGLPATAVATLLLAAALAVIGAGLIAWRISQPLRGLAGAAAIVGRGRYPARLAETGPTEVALVARAFNEMAGDLQRIERDRALFLAGLSHDLRTPLARLRLVAEMLPASGAGTAASAADGADAADTADVIRRSVAEADRIIGQFIDFARTEESEPCRSTDLNELVVDVLDEKGGEREEMRLRLDLSLPPLPLRPAAMRRLVGNLIENALRHGRAPIEISTRQSSIDCIEFAVADRGVGVPPHLARELTRPFVRLDRADKAHASTGLGLAIVERIARLHGGELALEQRPGGGLIAAVRLAVPPLPS